MLPLHHGAINKIFSSESLFVDEILRIFLFSLPHFALDVLRIPRVSTVDKVWLILPFLRYVVQDARLHFQHYLYIGHYFFDS